MKSNSKKHAGFALIEVVISIAILSIISIGIYDGFMIIIKQTKAGQVKQTAALEGKKIIEKIESTSFEVPSTTGAALSVGDISLKEEKKDGIVFYRRYLGENYNYLNENNPDNEKLRKYTEKITLTRKDITLNNNQTVDELANTSNVNYKVYIGKEKDSVGTTAEDYIKNDITDSPINLGSGSSKIVMYVYFETPSSSKNDRTIKIKDFEGTTLLETTETLNDTTSSNPSKVNLCMNFSYYKQITSLPKLDNSDLKDVEIYVYNKTGGAANIYLQKDSAVTADVQVCKGEINIYDNRSEDADQDRIGTLYDIKLEISDYLKYINDEIKKDNDNLFTGYYEKNID
jgi:prepilin-type N-terminal cleavage/methylation domain-containing protein